MISVRFHWRDRTSVISSESKYFDAVLYTLPRVGDDVLIDVARKVETVLHKISRDSDEKDEVTRHSVSIMLSGHIT